VAHGRNVKGHPGAYQEHAHHRAGRCQNFRRALQSGIPAPKGTAIEDLKNPDRVLIGGDLKAPQSRP